MGAKWEYQIQQALAVPVYTGIFFHSPETGKRGHKADRVTTTEAGEGMSCKPPGLTAPSPRLCCPCRGLNGVGNKAIGFKKAGAMHPTPPRAPTLVTDVP